MHSSAVNRICRLVLVQSLVRQYAQIILEQRLRGVSRSGKTNCGVRLTETSKLTLKLIGILGQNALKIENALIKEVAILTQFYRIDLDVERDLLGLHALILVLYILLIHGQL